MTVSKTSGLVKANDSNAILEQEKTFQSTIKSYSDFFSFSFQDLLKLSKKDKGIFIDLYYNRTPEYDKIKSMLKNVRNRGENILITGDAGKGKSNFMYRIFFDDSIINEYNIYPIIIDYRETPNNNQCMLNFIHDLDKYFESIKHPLNNLKENSEENIFVNIHSLQRHLSLLKENDLSKYLVIFLDDFDYIENDLFDLLEHFMPFACSNKSSIIISARPALYNAIKNYDSRFAVYFTRDVQRIPLKDLATSKLIAKRLAPILLEDKYNALKSLTNRLLGRNSQYRRLLKLYGINDLEGLEKLTLPFTNLYNNFMTSITNGNIREIFDITFDSLIFILNNNSQIQDVVESVVSGEN